MNDHTYSLEEVGTDGRGRTVLPLLCGACHQAIAQEPRRRSHPRSYAALAEGAYTYRVQDWHGMGTQCCRCCGTTAYGERFTAWPMRKVR